MVNRLTRYRSQFEISGGVNSCGAASGGRCVGTITSAGTAVDAAFCIGLCSFVKEDGGRVETMTTSSMDNRRIPISRLRRLNKKNNSSTTKSNAYATMMNNWLGGKNARSKAESSS